MATTEKKREGIYVELDVLLDTRMGTLKRMDDNLANQILLSGTYHTRDQDVFEGIDRAVFKENYKKRDVLTLSVSMLTNVIPMIRKLVAMLAEQAIQRPFHDGSEIIVNCYPYILSMQEQTDIEKAMTIWMQGIAPVKLVHIPLEELTPLHCKEKYSLMMMYEYAEWFHIHSERFARTQIPDITLFVPAIYFEKKPTTEEMENLVKEVMHPMEATEFLASSLIDLKLIDVKYFSIISDEKKTA